VVILARCQNPNIQVPIRGFYEHWEACPVCAKTAPRSTHPLVLERNTTKCNRRFNTMQPHLLAAFNCQVPLIVRVHLDGLMRICAAGRLATEGLKRASKQAVSVQARYCTSVFMEKAWGNYEQPLSGYPCVFLNTNRNLPDTTLESSC
jgi:hypothetical protein